MFNHPYDYMLDHMHLFIIIIQLFHFLLIIIIQLFHFLLLIDYNYQFLLFFLILILIPITILFLILEFFQVIFYHSILVLSIFDHFHFIFIHLYYKETIYV